MQRVAALVFLLPGFGCGSDTAPDLSADSFVMLEPVFLRVTCENDVPVAEFPSFMLLKDGRSVDCLSGCREPLVYRSGPSTYVCLYTLFLEDAEYVFPSSKEYTLRALERGTDTFSNEIRVTCRPGTRADHAVGTRVISLYRPGVGRSLWEKRLSDAVDDHPRSPIAPSARYHLLKKEAEHLPCLASNRKEELDAYRAARADLFGRYGDLPSKLPCPSEWHAESATLMVTCRAWAEGPEPALRDALELDRVYFSHPRFGPEIDNLIDSFSQSLGRIHVPRRQVVSPGRRPMTSDTFTGGLRITLERVLSAQPP